MKDENKVHLIHHRGDFYNLPFFHSNGNIFSRIMITEKDHYIDWDVMLKIADCDKTVSLTFDMDYDCVSENSFENHLHKVDVLIEHLKDFRKGLIAGAKVYRKAIKELEDKQAEKQTLNNK